VQGKSKFGPANTTTSIRSCVSGTDTRNPDNGGCDPRPSERVLILTMRKITKIAGDVGTKLRDRSRAAKLRTLDVARAARSKAKQSKGKL
jgi:hypothetical protein